MFDNGLEVSFTTDDWKYVKAEVEKQLNNARDAIEQKACTPEDTMFYKGRIALSKELLKLPEIALLVLRSSPTQLKR